jgi:ribosomal-protein-alanine N-acetyltransferase
MNMNKGFPILNTKRLLLREISEADLGDFFELFGNAEVLKFYGMRPYKNPEDAKGFMGRMMNKFSTKNGIRWAITTNERDEMVGTIGFKNWDTRSCKGEVSYELKPEFWNMGYITEALKQVVDFGFENGLNRIEAWDMKGNQASKRVLEKAGFTHEGTWREHTYLDGQYYEIEWFSILKREWTANQ